VRKRYIEGCEEREEKKSEVRSVTEGRAEKTHLKKGAIEDPVVQSEAMNNDES
jgi:hypothetical protein